jgi:hypothetical protein
VGGGSLLQTDAVWGLNAGSEIFQYNFTTKKLTQVAGELTQITVGDGDSDNCHPYEVWGLNAGDEVFRFNYCTLVFDNIPGFLTHISTGGGDVWGINVNGQVFQYNFLTQKWVQTEGALAQIAVGVNDVWGLDIVGNVYRYEGSSFVQINANTNYTQMSQIAAGGNGVWGSNALTHSVVRYDPNVEVDVLLQGTILTQIASGYGAGVWGVNSAGQIFSFVRP